MRRRMRTMITRSRVPVLLGLTLLSPGCGSDRVTIADGALTIGTGANVGPPPPGTPGQVKGFFGAVVADDPRAALIGRDILSAGGSAGDAVVAMGFGLTVTLPSRVGLGGGGACLTYAAAKSSVNGGVPEAVLFQPPPSAGSGAAVDRPAGVPMFARGMYFVHYRYGSLPFEALVRPAEQLARSGAPVSRALARDLAQVATPLFADPGARAVFGRNGQPLAEGQMLQQTDLGVTLAQIRISGVGDLYQGNLARKIEAGAPPIGAALSLTDLRGALPQVVAPVFASYRAERVAFLPPPADPGLTAAAFAKLQANGAVSVEPDSRPLPASSSFAAMDNKGNAVVCVATLNNLFGTGRILPGLGFLAAASPVSVPAPILSAGLVWNQRENAFRALAGGTGQAGAPIATAVALMNTLRTDRPMASPVPEPGRANVIACSRYMPDAEKSCAWASDPREVGLATGGGG